MRIVDLHCDTLYKSVTQNLPLDFISHEVQLDFSPNVHKLQCYAIWLPDDYSGDRAEQTVLLAAKRLENECKRLNIKLLKHGDNVKEAFESNSNCAFLTIENGSALNNKLENVQKFAFIGVRMMTLTWNARNAIGDGADVQNGEGLTPFGKQVLREMERNKIIIDISHASEKLFYDVAENTKLPFAASHSNAYSVTPHRRNLKDEQIDIIIKRGGLIGLNFHNAFLNENSYSASVTDILRHAEHFLSLGCEDVLCFGSDFDGGVLPADFTDSRVYHSLYELFLQHHYKESLIQKIFFANALNFFENFDNPRIMM